MDSEYHFKQIAPRELVVLAPSVHKNTKENPEHTLAVLNCIDDLLQMQAMSALLNTTMRGRRGFTAKGFHDCMGNRIEQLIAEEKQLGVSTIKEDIQLQIKLK